MQENEMDPTVQQDQVTQEEKVTSLLSDEPKTETEKQSDVAIPSPVISADIKPEEFVKTEECKLPQSTLTAESEPVVEPSKPVIEAKPTEVVEPKVTEVPKNKLVEAEIKPPIEETKHVEVEPKHIEAESKHAEAELKHIDVESKHVEVESKPAEIVTVAEPKSAIEPVITEEPKEVRSEEIPPPLPASNPPSPVTVFAESTMAEVSAPVVDIIPQPPLDPTICENVEPSIPVLNESSPLQSPVKEVESVAQSSLVVEHKEPEVVQEIPPSPVTEQIVNADSLPDISTESLPSLPEPLSESLPEPMSLPPVECVPEPIAKDESEPYSIPNIPYESEAVLTNGEANGLSSPILNGTNDDMDVTTLSIDIKRPVKQVVAANETTQSERQEVDDKQEDIESAPLDVKE